MEFILSLYEIILNLITAIILWLIASIVLFLIGLGVWFDIRKYIKENSSPVNTIVGEKQKFRPIILDSDRDDALREFRENELLLQIKRGDYSGKFFVSSFICFWIAFLGNKFL